MTGQRNQLVDWFVGLAVRLDRFLRRRDWKLQRSFDGPAKTFFGVDGYSPVAFLVFGIALLFQIFGPSLGWRDGLVAIGLLIIIPILLATMVKLLGAHRLWLGQITTVLIVSLIVFFYADPEAREAGDDLYRHILAPVLWVLIVAMLFAKWLSGRMFRHFRGRFSEHLKETELFVKPEISASVTSGSIFWSFVTVPVRHPLQLLLFPAFVVIVVQDAHAMQQWGLSLLGVSWLALALAGFHERLQFIISMPRRVFFVGAQLVISVLIILLAIGRIIDFSYVSILLDSTAGPVLAVLVFATYFTFWFYEYWINRLLCERLLGALDSKTELREARIDYPIKQDAILDHIRVRKDDRKIQIHGAERFVVVGKHLDKPEGEDDEVFHFYSKRDLFARILDWAVQRNALTRKAADHLLHELERRIQYYFLALNLLLVGAFIGSWLLLHGLPQVAELCVAPINGPLAHVAKAIPGCVPETLLSSEDGKRVDLSRLIAGSEQQVPARVVLVAASGGGTRAALYTASVLRGLNELGALRDVVLTSGVSGGSAALAYFAAHRDTLINGDEAQWKNYMNVMSAAFIRDVLRGVVEWRVAKGTRLGTLLAESFQHRMQPPQASSTLAGPSQIALIFNTALCGHLHRNDESKLPLAQWDAENKRLSRSDRAGGRLVLTNLDSTEYFPLQGVSNLPVAHFKYVVVNEPQIPVTTAGALSANFPPVFSNAAVDVREQDRYWVTDGGAADNRGLVSLLYALRHALENLGNGVHKQQLPKIHIVVAEASKEGFDFTQDRGIGANSGAAEKYASQLSDKLWQEITAQYTKLGGKATNIKLYYLAMPLTLRARGGLGTHWILPNEVKLENAVEADPDRSKAMQVTLRGAQVRDIIYELHSIDNKQCLTDSMAGDRNLKTVWEWICSDPVHAREWASLQASLVRVTENIAGQQE